MKVLSNLMYSQILFWLAWIIIPIIMEILPAIFDFFLLIKRKIVRQKGGNLEYLPQVSMIIPIYNSSVTLEECIKSIYESDYEKDKLSILCVDNGSKDNSFEIFGQCQKAYPDLTMNWIESCQGKSKALNMALFNCTGKYVIHIDSDGVLHKNAIKNMVTIFEYNEDIHCVTGTVLTNPELIRSTKKRLLRIFQETEFYEYCQAFLAGRNFQSELNSIFTLSGAFSAFRKSTIMETQLYNTDTVCEDTHITFQVRSNLKKRVVLCDQAYFFVDPIEDLNHLYTQRQRWQRGELEVIHMFQKQTFRKGFFSDFVVRLLMYDHTFAFPRMIWYFALIYLVMMKYPYQLIIQSIEAIYVLYVLSAFLFYFNILSFLSNEKTLQRYYRKKWYQIFLLPVFNFLVFWFRFAGIINSIRSEQNWRTRDLTQEYEEVKKIISQDIRFGLCLVEKIRSKLECDKS